MVIELHSTHLGVNSNLLNGSSSYLLSTSTHQQTGKGGCLISFSCQSPKGAGSFDKGLDVEDHIDLSKAVEKEVACFKS